MMTKERYAATLQAIQKAESAIRHTKDEYLLFHKNVSVLGDLANDLARELAEKEIDHEHA